ncbi:unnamed protein product [Somion occarium]|uniref:Auxin efflux carrier n=1 Tax=Somion occarium TaxID=3059160 RepID=A0ABP1CYZ4_9APHY
MASAGFLIYSGVMPLLKTLLSIIVGYVLARMELFPRASSKGASQLTMNVALPLLIFSNIVPAFTPQNVSAIGPMFLIAFIYQGFGFFFGILIREIFYVPRNFWQGIIIVTGLSNWGNLPNAIVLSVTAQAPFDPSTDPALGVSFVAIFTVAYHITFFVGGAAHSLSWDYLPGIPQGEAAELHVPWKQKPLGSLFARYILKENAFPPPSLSKSPMEVEAALDETNEGKGLEDSPSGSTIHLGSDEEGHQLTRQTTRVSIVSTGPYPVLPTPSQSSTPQATSVLSENDQRNKFSFIPPVVRRVIRHLSTIVTPVTVSLAISLPIALIQPLKALFVDISSLGGPNLKGPDGRPPLAFITDTADFIGSMTVPLALILLGASFARLSVPRPFSRLPILAMLAVTFAKMLVLPVIGVFVVQAMIKGGLINHNSRVEKFVAMLLSGSPSAVNQLIVASLYSPDGNVDTLAAFLLVQYVLMFISSSALTAVSLLLS